MALSAETGQLYDVEFKIMKKGLLIGFFLVALLPVIGQEDYIQVLTKRADKIVSTLGITDSVQYIRVRSILVNQYVTLGKIHDGADTSLGEINSSDKPVAVKDSLSNIIKLRREASLYTLHCAFVALLYGELTCEQVEAVRNGMTYDVLNVTFKAQLDMIPRLTDEEKRQIRIWLLEAREHAMDAASSEEKHAWFGKYKGRINNYLSERGYDLERERAGWNERIRAGNSQTTR